MNTTVNPTMNIDAVPSCWTAAPRNGFYAGIGAAALFVACGDTSVCDKDINNEQCTLIIERIDKGKLVFYQNTDKTIKIIIEHRLDNEAIQVDLLKTTPPVAEAKNVFTLPGITEFPTDHIYSIKLNTADIKNLASGGYSLRFQGRSGRQPAYLTDVLLRKPVGYESPIISQYAGNAHEVPIAEQIGFVGNAVVTVNSGLDNISKEAKQVRIYNYDMAKNVLNNPAPTGYFAFPFPKETLAGFSQSNLFLLNQTVDSLLLRRCTGVTPASIADCPPLDADMKMMVQADKALVATPDGTRVVRADSGGNLKQAATQAPLKWEAVATTAMFSAAATVKVASGDMNGDGKADLVAIWQEGSSQQVRVFLGRDGGFEPDPVWTDRLQTGLGSETVTALAVGDVDADGCADVVLGRGLELAVLQNKPDGFVKVWSHMINPPLVTKITAVAVGRLAGSDPNQSLDIVTASNTPYDNSMTPVSTLYLHAFRPQ